MSEKKHDIIDIIDGIDDEIIEKQSERRAKLFGRKRRIYYNKTFQRVSAVVVSVAILMLLIIPLFLMKQVPIYTGMTVSTEPPEVVMGDDSVVPLAATPGSNIISDLKDFLIGPSLEVEDGEKIYYANPGEDIYVTVHLSNPDKFEILSFTLNGEKYTSYMFEKGSDLENLVLKLNVGDDPGLVEYTIDQIKYVDGERIKDVRMDGDRTVKVGVYDRNQPTASVKNFNIGYRKLSFNALANDPSGLAAAYGDGIFALLYDGDEIVEKVALTQGEESEITFNNLDALKDYTAVVAAVFDAFDGDGLKVHILYQKAFSVDPAVFFEEVKVSGTGISYITASHNSIAMIERIQLLDKNETVVATVADETGCFPSLDGGAYKLRITYSYQAEGGKVSATTDSEELFIINIAHRPIEGVIYKVSDGSTLYPTYNDKTFAVHANGIDWRPTGTNLDVYAVVDGRVTRVYDNPNYATTVIVTDEFGYQYVYQSLASASVTAGDEVSVGDVIGTMGTCDIEAADGVHLHFTMRTPEGKLIDPNFEAALTAEDIFTTNTAYLKYVSRYDVVNTRKYKLAERGVLLGEVTYSYATSTANTEIESGIWLAVRDENLKECTISVTMTALGVSKTVEFTIKTP